MIIYWFNLIENLGIACVILASILMIMSIILFACLMIDPPYDEDDLEVLKKRTRRTFAIGLFFIFLASFLPSRSVLMQTYVVDNIARFVEDNEKSKELPDKVIECCHKLLNDYLENNK